MSIPWTTSTTVSSPCSSTSSAETRSRRKQVSVSEVVEAHISRIELVNPHINAVVVDTFTDARRQAREADRFTEEIVPVEVSGKKGTVRVESDEHPRDGVSAESLARLPPVFRKHGTVHAGNASGITDGAAACLVLPTEEARRLDVRPAARIVGYATSGVDPEIMGIGPVSAVRALEKSTGIELQEIDLVEMNEAFAAQVLACVRDLGIDPDRLNVNGGAIALGHPIGCTGTRIVTTLMYEMERRSARHGLATLCISGGMGMALLLERILWPNSREWIFWSWTESSPTRNE